MKHLLITLIIALFLGNFTFAQTNTDASQSPTSSPASTQPADRTSSLPAGKEVKDSKGRKITNNGTNENGSVKIRYSGRLDRTTTPWTCSGEITVVTNPASQGSEGPIEVTTNNKPTEVNLDKNGTHPNGHINSTINGNNATVNQSGNYNNTTINGNNSTLNVTGNHNTANVNGTNNTTNLGGHSNSVTSGGNTVRN